MWLFFARMQILSLTFTHNHLKNSEGILLYVPGCIHLWAGSRLSQNHTQLLQPRKGMCFGYERNYLTKYLAWSNHNVLIVGGFFLSSCVFQKEYLRYCIDLKQILQLGIGNILYNSMWLMKHCMLPSGLQLSLGIKIRPWHALSCTVN